jgi:hypothetical protein
MVATAVPLVGAVWYLSGKLSSIETSIGVVKEDVRELQKLPERVATLEAETGVAR